MVGKRNINSISMLYFQLTNYYRAGFSGCFGFDRVSFAPTNPVGSLLFWTDKCLDLGFDYMAE